MYSFSSHFLIYDPLAADVLMEQFKFYNNTISTLILQNSKVNEDKNNFKQ